MKQRISRRVQHCPVLIHETSSFVEEGVGKLSKCGYRKRPLSVAPNQFSTPLTDSFRQVLFEYRKWCSLSHKICIKISATPKVTRTLPRCPSPFVYVRIRLNLALVRAILKRLRRRALCGHRVRENCVTRRDELVFGAREYKSGRPTLYF